MRELSTRRGAPAMVPSPLRVRARALADAAPVRDARSTATNPDVERTSPGGVLGTGRFARTVEDHLGSRDVARTIYGSVIGLALVVALQDHPPTAAATAAQLVAAALAVGLADAYSEAVGGEARTRRPIAAPGVGRAVRNAMPIVFGAGFPAVFFCIAATGAIDTSAAFVVSKWSGLGIILAYGFLAGRLSGAGVGGAVVHAALVGAIGGGVILVKAVVH
jgi:hypothetical protein